MTHHWMTHQLMTHPWIRTSSHRQVMSSRQKMGQVLSWQGQIVWVQLKMQTSRPAAAALRGACGRGHLLQQGAQGREVWRQLGLLLLLQQLVAVGACLLAVPWAACGPTPPQQSVMKLVAGLGRRPLVQQVPQVQQG